MPSVNPIARVVVNTVRASASPTAFDTGLLLVRDANYAAIPLLSETPDRTFDRTAANLTWPLLATTISEQEKDWLRFGKKVLHPGGRWLLLNEKTRPWVPGGGWYPGSTLQDGSEKIIAV